MSTLMRFVGGSIFAFVLAGTGLAQENRATIENPQAPVAATPLVTATATAKRVRFVSPGTVVQLRLEVYNEAGQKLFDTELHGGNVLDWHLQDGAGQDLQSGSYACVLTIKSLSGRLSQRVGLVTVNDKKAAISAAEGGQLSLAQQQTIGPVEGNATLTIRQESEGEAITAVTHDGTEGQLTSTKGALTFRTGDIFSGKEKEQMRLTEDGRLGIGTSEPRAKLDVAGTISAQRFVIAKPKVAGADKTGILSADTPATDSVEVQPLIAGTGTQDRIAKWVDNAGTLGDSVIAESAGNIGIGTTIPTHKLDVQNPGANGAIRSVNETFGVRGLISEQHSSNVVGAIFVGLKSRGTLAAPTAVVPGDFGAFFSNKWFDGTSYVQSGAFGFTVDGPVSQGVVPTRLSFITSTTSGNGSTAHGVERMTILSGGNVGIGTTTPTALLDVAGNMNVTGNAVIGGNIAAKYQDVAEWVPARDHIEPSTLVTLDPILSNSVVPSRRAYDTRVAGVISPQPGLILGEPGEGKVLVATTGRVKIKVDATRHPIKIGDLLVTSNIPGFAMKSMPIKIKGGHIHRPGTIVGKALEPLSKGRGEILVLLSLQ